MFDSFAKKAVTTQAVHNAAELIARAAAETGTTLSKKTTTPIPEPAGEIVLPEAVNDTDGCTTIKLPDGFFIRRYTNDPRWYAWDQDGFSVKGVSNPYDTPEAAAAALRDIGHGPGAVVEKKPAAQPAPPPFDVERLAEVLEECRELIIHLRPLSHRWFTDNRDHHIIGRIDAIRAALGGKE